VESTAWAASKWFQGGVDFVSLGFGVNVAFCVAPRYFLAAEVNASKMSSLLATNGGDDLVSIDLALRLQLNEYFQAQAGPIWSMLYTNLPHDRANTDALLGIHASLFIGYRNVFVGPRFEYGVLVTDAGPKVAAVLVPVMLRLLMQF
jgi:hypothetical protein